MAKGKSMINLYETKGVKKFTSKNVNKSWDKTRMNLNSRSLVCSPSGGGKTNLLANYLLRCENTYHKIYICYKESEPIYDWIREQLKDKVEFFTNPSQLPTLEDMRKDKNGKKIDDESNILLVIDDWVDQIDKYPSMQDIVIRSRRYLTLIFISQSYFKIPILYRKNCTYLLLLKLNGVKDAKLVLADHVIMDIEPEKLLAIYKESVKEKFNFFKIDVNSGDPNKKYSHNFDGFFKLENDTN